MATLLLIDNQILQFRGFSKRLSNAGHTVLPFESDFNKIIGLVKIALNYRYDFPTRQQALKQIEIYIIEDKKVMIDVFILDHKLIGNHKGKSAFYLLEKLRKINSFKNIPVIFLSRTPRNHPDVKDKLDILEKENCIWVEKGYAGRDIMDENYFKKFVIDKIPELIEKGEYNSSMVTVTKLLQHPQLADFKYVLEGIMQEAEIRKSFSEKQKKIIKALPLPGSIMSRTIIDNIFNDYTSN